MVLDVHDIAVSGILSVVNKPIFVKIFEQIIEKIIPIINTGNIFRGNIFNNLDENKGS